MNTETEKTRMLLEQREIVKQLESEIARFDLCGLKAPHLVKLLSQEKQDLEWLERITI